MTQPYYPPQYPQAPQQPQYAPPQPQYPAQYPQQPAQHYYPQPPPPPAVPTVAGDLGAFFNQPSVGGGKSLSFEQPGQRYIGIVVRPITNGDIEQQTDTQGRPQTFKDGRPKFVMKVPLQMQPGPAYPDGLAQWYVKGQARDELVRAMAQAHAPEGPPEAGAIVDITFTGTRPAGAGMNPAKLFRVVYQRPQGAVPVVAETATAAAPVQPPSPPVAAPPAPPQVLKPTVQAPSAPAAVPAPPISTAPGVAQIAPPEGLSAEQQALLTRLTGGSQ